MESKKSSHKLRSKDFIFNVLRDYYSSGKSGYFICNKYKVHAATFLHWKKKYELEGKELSLSREIIDKVKSMRKNEDENSPANREKELERQVSDLRKALEYSELRNEALMEVIDICKREYGFDLLKKAGAKQ